MKPVQTITMLFALCAVSLLFWPTCLHAEVQSGHDDQDVLQPAGDRPQDSGANPRADEFGRPDGRRHRRELHGEDRQRRRSLRSNDRGPRGPRRDDPDRMQDFLTEKERQELLAFTKEHFPKMYELLSRAKGEQQNRMLRRVGWPMLRLLRLHRHDPELAEKLIAEHKIEMELGELKRDYQEFPSESARASIKQKMRELLEQRFTLRQQRLELEIQALEKRLEEARKRLERQEADRQRLIDSDLERMVELLQDERMWGPGIPPLGQEPGPPGGPPDHPGPPGPR